MTLWYEFQRLPYRVVGRLSVLPSSLLGRRTGRSVGILTYHRISPRIAGLPYPRHNVTPKRLESQLTGLLDRGFHVWPLQRVLSLRDAAHQIPPKTLVLTFDDAYQTVYTNAYPILKRLQLPATIFAATAYIDQQGPMPCDEWGTKFHLHAPSESYRALTLDQCRELHNDELIELGAHTHEHIDNRGRPEAFRADVQRSVDFLRENFGIETPSFAFPYGCPYRGFAADDLVEAAKRTEVCCGLTTEPVTIDLNSDPFIWGRFNAFSWDTATTLAAKLNGWYSWAPRLRRSMVRSVYPRAYNRHRNTRTPIRSRAVETLPR